MVIASVLLLMSSGLAGPAAPVPVTDLAVWQTRLGLTLSVPAGCRSSTLGQNLLLDCGGVGLVFAPPGAPEASLVGLIASQAAPFADAGIKVPSPTASACSVQGVSAECMRTTITVPPGAPMTLLAGKRTDQDWVVLCLHRQVALPPLCASYFASSG